MVHCKETKAKLVLILAGNDRQSRVAAKSLGLPPGSYIHGGSPRALEGLLFNTLIVCGSARKRYDWGDLEMVVERSIAKQRSPEGAPILTFTCEEL